MLGVFSQLGVHSTRLAIRLPSLWFDEERATWFQHAVCTLKKRADALIAVVEMNPFRDGEAGKGRVSGGDR